MPGVDSGQRGAVHLQLDVHLAGRREGLELVQHKVVGEEQILRLHSRKGALQICKRNGKLSLRCQIKRHEQEMKHTI